MLVSTRSWPGISEAWQWSMGVGQSKGQEKSQRPWSKTEASLGILRICTRETVGVQQRIMGYHFWWKFY